jgi:hypothetical protein|tara:strand:+ start:4406 stop:4558 length:153 start_codon:yes stop_codon:yes gene_type:complete
MNSTQRRLQRRAKEQRRRALRRLFNDSLLIVPSMFLWLGLVFVFILELSK